MAGSLARPFLTIHDVCIVKTLSLSLSRTSKYLGEVLKEKIL